jgi:hypothetical protein
MHSLVWLVRRAEQRHEVNTSAEHLAFMAMEASILHQTPSLFILSVHWFTSPMAQKQNFRNQNNIF